MNIIHRPHPGSSLEHQLHEDYKIISILAWLFHRRHYGCKGIRWYASICQLLIEFLRSVVYIFQFSIRMFKKNDLPRLSSKNLKPLALHFAEGAEEPLEEVIRTIQTPRHQSFKIRDREPTQTQKLAIAKRATAIREKLPAITSHGKENLLDLDLCFDFDLSRGCQNERLTERHNFVVRRVSTPSKSSKGKDTSAGSSDSSLDEHPFPIGKNATESPQVKLAEGRGKSHSKQLQPCRIVNSKKLPFNLNQRGVARRKWNLEEIELDISVIQAREGEDQLITMESYQNLCALL